MIKLYVLNMQHFLHAVSLCRGKVNLLQPDGTKENINQSQAHPKLIQQFRQNKNYLPVWLDIPNPKDYIRLVAYHVENF